MVACLFIVLIISVISDCCAKSSAGNLNAENLAKRNASSIKAGDRIINGRDASIESHPWAVFLMMSSGINKFRCGGTIVGSNLIATARHCIDNFEQGLGGYGSAAYKDFKQEFEFSPENCIKHDALDVGLIQLGENLELNGGKAREIKIAGNGYNPKPGQKVMIYGWGKVASNNQQDDPSTLQEIQVPVKADNECGGGNGYFCAGGPQGNKPMDSCTGDSGSGVECTGQKGGTFLCGIVSSGPAPPNCGVQAGKYVSVGYGTVNSFLNMKNGRYTPMERGESSVVAEFRDKSSYFFSVIFLLLLK